MACIKPYEKDGQAKKEKSNVKPKRKESLNSYPIHKQDGHHC